MCFTPPITQTHFNLCVSIIERRITLDLPLPHTDKVVPFSKIAGIENLESLRKSGKYIPGCYRIWGLNNSDDLCYIGQSTHLGLRVKYHTKGQNKNTREFCINLGGQGKVDLFILPPLNEIPSDIFITQFLCVLEQYLIFKYRPKINKLLVAMPGIIWNKDTITKHRKKVGKKIYIYIKSVNPKNNLEFIFMCDSASYASQLLGHERSWITNILKRDKGWYKDKLYFSLIPLNELEIKGKIYGIAKNLKNINKVKSYIYKLLKGGLSRKGKMIRVTNTINKEVILYRSKREAARYLKADPTSFYNRDKLFRGIYKIEVLE